MSSKVPLPRLVVDKIPLRYVDQPEKLAPFFKSFEAYVDATKQNRERLDSPTDGFVTGTMDMISGDLKFEQGMHQECIGDFTRASDAFLKAQKVTETQINEGQIQVPSEILRELGRRAIYCQARITHAEALIELKKAKNVTVEERGVIKQFLELAAQAYQEEIEVDEQNDDFYHKLQAKKNLCKVYIRLEEQRALISDTIQEQRNHYYQAMIQAQKAIFLGEKKIPKVYFEGTYNKIQELSIKKFLNRADYFWEQGLISSANKDFAKASKLFWAGQKIYESISKLEKRTEFDLQNMMFKVTALESDAKNEMANDQNIKATILFKSASELMQQIIKLVKQLGNTELVDLFSIQSAYFDGMNLFSSGLIAYDKEDYTSALKSIKISQRSLKAVLSSAREMDNAPLIQSCKDGLKQIETYIETLTLLTTPDPEPKIVKEKIEEVRKELKQAIKDVSNVQPEELISEPEHELVQQTSEVPSFKLENSAPEQEEDLETTQEAAEEPSFNLETPTAPEQEEKPEHEPVQQTPEVPSFKLENPAPEQEEEPETIQEAAEEPSFNLETPTAPEQEEKPEFEPVQQTSEVPSFKLENPAPEQEEEPSFNLETSDSEQVKELKKEIEKKLISEVKKEEIKEPEEEKESED